MRRRRKLRKRSSRRLFRRTAGTRKRNLRVRPMRGGYRL